MPKNKKEVNIFEDYLKEVELKGYKIPNKEDFSNEEHENTCLSKVANF